MKLINEKTINGIHVKYYLAGNIVFGITTNVGPRIIHLSLSSRTEQNIFGIVPEFAIETPEGLWKIYGGHRLWVSPEAMPRSYSMDDKPIKIIERDNEIELIGNPEPQNSIRKRIIIRERSDPNSLEVIHIIDNIGRWPIKFSCWAMSVMAKEGYAIVPFWPHKVDERGLLPDRILSIWPYTRLNDHRLLLSSKHIVLRQDPKIEHPIKIGVTAYPYWASYYWNELIFIKQFEVFNEEYPDYGVYVEAFTNDKFLELETLGPLREIEPGGSNTHREIWRLEHIGKLDIHDEKLTEKINEILEKK